MYGKSCNVFPASVSELVASPASVSELVTEKRVLAGFGRVFGGALGFCNVLCWPFVAFSLGFWEGVQRSVGVKVMLCPRSGDTAGVVRCSRTLNPSPHTTNSLENIGKYFKILRMFKNIGKMQNT